MAQTPADWSSALQTLQAAPDLPDDWPSADAVKTFGDAYRRWCDRRDHVREPNPTYGDLAAALVGLLTATDEYVIISPADARVELARDLVQRLGGATNG